MAMWLYQINQKIWSPDNFRYEIRETHRWRFTTLKKMGKDDPVPGDVVVFSYTKSSGERPGIYGWAVIDRYDAKTRSLWFTPSAPTDHLKIDPWHGEKVKGITDKIHSCFRFAQATLFPIPPDIAPDIQQGIKEWLRLPYASK